MAMNRRSFVAAVVAAVVSGKGRRLAPHKPRGRELVDAAPPTQPDDRAPYFRIIDRKTPPGYEFYYDPKVMRRLQLSGVDEEILRTASEEDASAHFRRAMARMTENRHMMTGRRWMTLQRGQLTSPPLNDDDDFYLANTLRP